MSLEFNEETGEWYTTDDSETPIDAQGNPITPVQTPVDIGSSDWLKGIEKLLIGGGSGAGGGGAGGGGTGSGISGQLLAIGGIGALLNKIMGGSSPSGFAGYKGGIPTYVASRQQTPIEQQRPTTTTAEGQTVPYRPGQGGITYFTPMTFAPPAPASTTTDHAAGGLLGLAAGGRFLRGPGDGVSDSIPATIGQKQPARLADGEFVVDARTVSELGNGSSEAGARKLYQMMDRVHAARKKAKRGQASGADKYLPR